MTGREHLLLGAGSVLAVGVALRFAGSDISTGALLGATAAAAAGSLAPDLDHPHSLASLSIPVSLLVYGVGVLLVPLFSGRYPVLAAIDLSSLPGAIAAAWVAVVLGVLLLGLSIAARARFGHRGPVHSLAFGVAATFGVLATTLVLRGPLWVPPLFAWGWATHLAADATTKMGLPRLLWPFDEEEAG